MKQSMFKTGYVSELGFHVIWTITNKELQKEWVHVYIDLISNDTQQNGFHFIYGFSWVFFSFVCIYPHFIFYLFLRFLINSKLIFLSFGVGPIMREICIMIS